MKSIRLMLLGLFMLITWELIAKMGFPDFVAILFLLGGFVLFIVGFVMSFKKENAEDYQIKGYFKNNDTDENQK